MTAIARVLIADDEVDLIEDYHAALAMAEPKNTDTRLAELQDELFGPQHCNSSLPPIELVSVNQGEAAVQAVSRAQDEHRPFSVAFIDVRMPPGINGLDAAAKIREIDERLPIVIVTAYTDIQMIDLAKKVPPADRLFVLQKPFHTTEIQQLAIALTARGELDRMSEGASEVETLPRLDRILSGLPGGIAIFDENERLVQTNEGLGKLFPDLKDEAGPGIRYDAWRAKIAQELAPDQVLKRKGAEEGRLQLADASGLAARRLSGNRWVMIAEQFESTGGTVVQFLDVTRMKVAEQRRAIGSTMAHMSRLAGALVERAEAEELGRSAAAQEISGAADETAAGQRSVLEDLTVLAQRRQLSPRPSFLDALANETAATLEHGIPKAINIETVSSVGLWPVFVDPDQTRDVLRALILNAAEAVDGRGSVVVETANVRATREAASEMPGLKSGEYVRLSITDSGPGMQPELIDRAVMPFFTTKDPKEHSGMGLTAAYSFVLQSGGRLFIDSDGQSGTTVNLFLPRLPESVMAGKRGLRRH